MARQRRGDFCCAGIRRARWSQCPEVRAFADRGLEGDRFFRESWNAVNRSDKAVSLIEDEVLQLAAKELAMDSIGSSDAAQYCDAGRAVDRIARS